MGTARLIRAHRFALAAVATSATLFGLTGSAGPAGSWNRPMAARCLVEPGLLPIDPAARPLLPPTVALPVGGNGPISTLFPQDAAGADASASFPPALDAFQATPWPRDAGPAFPAMPRELPPDAPAPSHWPREDAAPTPPELLPAVPAAQMPGAGWAPSAAPQPATGPAARSAQLEQMAQEADRHTRQGFELAGRNAPFAARDEFVAALKLVAQGLDSEERTSRHSEALADALTAMHEADDFLAGQASEVATDLEPLVRRHRTLELKEVPLTGISPMAAMQRYFTYAQAQFTVACGGEAAGSMALHGLGKLYMAMAQRNVRELGAPEPKAVTCFQAAVLVYPANFMAANELGVLLARCGQYEAARAAVEHSLSVRPESTAWHNLSVIYTHLGLADLAARAARLAEQSRQVEQAVRQTSPQPVRGEVEWMTPDSFGETYAQVPNAQGPAPVRNVGPPAPGDGAAQSSNRWFPWIFPR